MVLHLFPKYTTEDPWLICTNPFKVEGRRFRKKKRGPWASKETWLLEVSFPYVTVSSQKYRAKKEMQ
jgi:hypothetical protein